jgi:thiamine biosynthesis lipoprotein
VHHLIDPRTGRPAAGDLAEVSVVAATAVEAEVFAKTALLLGSEPAAAFLAAHCQAWWLGPG